MGALHPRLLGTQKDSATDPFNSYPTASTATSDIAQLGVPTLAWDSVGHRLSAAVALEFMEPDTAAELMRILRAHPRYQQDFIDQIPGYIDRDNEEQMTQWLLGQAAFWPDIARGLPMRNAHDTTALHGTTPTAPGSETQHPIRVMSIWASTRLPTLMASTEAR